MKELYKEKTSDVGGTLDEIYKTELNYKTSWMKEARRCVAYTNGAQNVKATSSVMVDNQPIEEDTRERAYDTNEIEPIARTLVSYMTRKKPTIACYASSNLEQDKNVAKISEKLLDAKYDLDHEFENSRQAAYWALTLGSVFRKDFWDVTKGAYVGSIDDKGNPVYNEQGAQNLELSGLNNSVILTPFSITVDHSQTNFDEMPYIGEHYVMDVDWAREAFDRNEPGYLGTADKIAEDNSLGECLDALEELKYTVPYVGSTKERSKGKCLISEWYLRPNREFPKGRMLIKAGGQWVYDSESSYFLDMEDVMYHPYGHFRFEMFIGRFLGKSLVSPLIPLQIRLKEINGAIVENANTLAKPNIMAAEKQLVKGIINGKGAQIYTYKHVPWANRPPFVMEGTPLPTQFFQERQNIIDSMVRIAATNFVMQGQPPSGVSAAAAIQMLLENASNQHSDMMLAWERFHEEGFQKKLRIIHKFQKYPDKRLEKYVRQFCRDSLLSEVKDFVGSSDLSDGITVKIQTGSMIPKSEITQRETYKELAKDGLLGPMKDPTPEGAKLRNQMLERLGESPFDTEETIEVKKAKWENQRMKDGMPVEVSPYDIGPIHRSIHVGELQDPFFLENADDKVKIAYDDHIKAHDEMDASKQPPQPMLDKDGKPIVPQGMPANPALSG